MEATLERLWSGMQLPFEKAISRHQPTDPGWAAFKAILPHLSTGSLPGWTHQKRRKSIPVTYWNFVYRHKETGKKLSEAEVKSTPIDLLVKTAFLKYYRVFQCG
jgi:hypothetical protein